MDTHVLMLIVHLPYLFNYNISINAYSSDNYLNNENTENITGQGINSLWLINYAMMLAVTFSAEQ